MKIDYWLPIGKDYVAIDDHEGVVGVLRWMDVQSCQDYAQTLRSESTDSSNVPNMLKRLNHSVHAQQIRQILADAQGH